MAVGYYRINSTLKQANGFNYSIADGLDRNKNPRNKSVTVFIQGQYRPGDKVLPTYITEVQYKNLTKEVSGVPSAFSLMIAQGQLGEAGILPQKCTFIDLPDSAQKEFDLKSYNRLASVRQKRDEKIAAAALAEQEQEQAEEQEEVVA